MIPHFGGLTGTDYTATQNEPLPERVNHRKKASIRIKSDVGVAEVSPPDRC